MKSINDVKLFFKQAGVSTNPIADRGVLDDAIQAGGLVLEKRVAHTGGNLRRYIMRNGFKELVVAAIVVIVATVSLQFFGGGPAAYALEQTINANHSVRYLHMRNFSAGHEEAPKEFWIACDDQGQVQNVRYFLPAWESPYDGAKSVVWSRGVAKVWFPKKNSLVIHRNETIPTWILDLVQGSDPRYAVERLRSAEQEGRLTIDIQQPTDKSQSIVVTATYIWDGKSPSRREILYVDQATKLVAAIEYYHRATDGQFLYDGRQEHYDYNIPIAPEMFTLEDDVPADVVRIDQVAQDVGLAQGTITDEQVVVEVVRQFLEALMAGDYDKAGILHGGVPAKTMQERYGDMTVVRIVSIDEPKPHPTPGVGGFVVPCKVEIEDASGTRRTREYRMPGVRPVDPKLYPDRWYIHGGL